MIKANTHKLITCLLPKGVAPRIVKALKEEKGIYKANINSARGLGKITPLAYRGVGEQSEKEILNVVVENPLAEDIFEFIYHEADINRPHGGMMYQCDLQQATPFVLPELPEEE